MTNQQVIRNYRELKLRIVKRNEQFNSFIEFLENETTWLTSPASTAFHLNTEGGLLEHSVGTALVALKLRAAIAPWIDEESCIICSLFHDVGKLGEPANPLYLKNENQWERKYRNRTYKTNPETTPMGLGVRSLYLVARYMSLTDEEAQAIAYHDGQYIDDNRIVAHREKPLTLLIHYADYWTAHIYESGLKDFPGEYLLCPDGA